MVADTVHRVHCCLCKLDSSGNKYQIDAGLPMTSGSSDNIPEIKLAAHIPEMFVVSTARLQNIRVYAGVCGVGCV